MTVRPDNRLSDAPMTPVSCDSCGARVLVRKSSWEQTSVQWDSDALAVCPERRELLSQSSESDQRISLRPGLFLSCSRLRDSIEDAVRRGDLVIVGQSAARSGR